MRATVLSFAAFVGSLIVLTDVSVAQQNQITGVKIEAKRSADLPADQGNRPRVSIDVEKAKEFDRISGTCLGPENSLVAGASIQLYRKTPCRDGNKEVVELVASAETGSDGKFAFDNLQAQFPTDKYAKFFILVVRKEGYATKFLGTLGWKSGYQEIKLENRAMVKGVIKNDLGQPVSDAKVSFKSENPLRASLLDVYATKSDREGRFQINDFRTVNSVPRKSSDGKMRGIAQVPLSVEHSDYGSVELNIDRTPNFFTVTISRGVKFSGRVVNEQDEPVANCLIRVLSHNNREGYGWFETTSDNNGKFQFTQVPGISVNLYFMTDGLIHKIVETTGEPGSETNLGDLILVTPIVIQGVVIDDETGEPVKLKEGRTFTIGWHGPEQVFPELYSRADIEADGTFECRFLPGINHPFVANPGHLQVVDEPYEDGIEITAESNQTLEFRVRHRELDDK